jgi:hypothetical protein
MMRKFPLFAAMGLLAAAIACGDESPSPAAPSAPGGSVTAGDGSNALADGSTLKVTAPAPVSPANGARLETFDVVLRVNPAEAKFSSNTPLAYRYELLRGGTKVDEFRGATTQWTPSHTFESNTEYSWRARAEEGTFFGPWSAASTFRTPEQPEGYNVPGELYDPLYTGKSVGSVRGGHVFVPGIGVQLQNFTSHVEYRLPQTIPEGEFSVMVTNTPANTEGGKTKIMSMREGFGDITTNDRRLTIEKRGNPPGIIAFRIISHHSQEETQGAERVTRNFVSNRWYLWKATYRGGRFQLEIFEDGANGRRIYSFGKNYDGLYDPNPHLVYIGAPVGRGGPVDATVPGMIAKQLWVSSRPRPAFANK